MLIQHIKIKLKKLEYIFINFFSLINQKVSYTT